MAQITFPSTPTVGQVHQAESGVYYKWNGSAWISKGSLGSTFINNIALSDLPDVTVTGLTSGDLLQWNGVDWVNVPSLPTNETIDDRVNSLLVAGSGIVLDYNDTLNTLTINSEVTSLNFGDLLSSSVIAGSNLSLSYDNDLNILTINATIPAEYLTSTEADLLYAPINAVSTHVGLTDPHIQYQKESEKGANNGYAGLGPDGKVPLAQLPPLGGGAGGLSPWVVLTADNYQLVNEDRKVIDTTTVSTVILPASPTVGMRIQLGDYKGDFAINNVTVLRNGENIMGTADDLILDVSESITTLEYIDSTKGWMVS